MADGVGRILRKPPVPLKGRLWLKKLFYFSYSLEQSLLFYGLGWFIPIQFLLPHSLLLQQIIELLKFSFGISLIKERLKKKRNNGLSLPFRGTGGVKNCKPVSRILFLPRQGAIIYLG